MGLKSFVYTYLDALAKRIDKKRFGTTSQSFVAMFHDVVKPGVKTDEFGIDEDKFEQIMNEWKRDGFDFVSMDTFINNFSTNKKIALTFDDGFASTYDLALNYLIPNKIPFTIFVTTTFLGKDGYISEDQLKELSRESLCTIGLHGNQHLAFRYEKNSFLVKDFLICKEKMDMILHDNIKYYYAFPYGSVYSVSYRNCKTIKKMGVKGVFVTRQRKVNQSDVKKAIYIPRLNIPGMFK